MADQAKERLVHNVSCIVDQAQPTDEDKLKLARKLTQKISQHIEAVIGKSDEKLSEPSTIEEAANNKEVAELLGKAMPWLDGSLERALEKHMYPCISALLTAVSRMLEHEPVENKSKSTSWYRLIFPHEKTDTKPKYSDDANRIDVGLVDCPTDGTIAAQAMPNYRTLFVVIEAKRTPSKADTEEAYAQLFGYVRHLYACQPDRRFVWGLICCGSVANACIFTNYCAYASPNMNVTTPGGREEFVRLLVGLSLCDLRQLGRDETISSNLELNCLEINVPTSNSKGECKTYYSNNVLVSADRLFGRHNRCFAATDIQPEKRVSDDNPMVYNAVIKDTWAMFSSEQAPSKGKASIDHGDDDGDGQSSQPTGATPWPSAEFEPAKNARCEVAILKKIKKILGNEYMKGRYPEVVAGGCVYQPLSPNNMPDCTREVVGGLDLEQQLTTPFCLHVRYAMSPVGEPLDTVRSVRELLIVLRDAMECHFEIFTKCGILHHDISNNNILVVRDDDGGVHGLLIDFDCAIDSSLVGSNRRPERTGTLPFMSVANLENLPFERTMLDDWESLLYLVCWLGSYGINDTVPPRDDAYKLPIRDWSVGQEIAKIALIKRHHLNTFYEFRRSIIDNFNTSQPGYDLLQRAAAVLHSTLFFNKTIGLDAKCKGSVVTNGLDAIPEDEDDVFGFEDMTISRNQTPPKGIDPFVERMKYAKKISEQLLGVLKKAVDKAKESDN
ncbi:hypothetical protein GGI25_004675 [Coemansia spiralis]|uniref:Fungal-type protein kinase domain-containing protein n=2 Tax=Coemansia TaxID=4863 RepID=A0A9W8G658_9FUNG|nr:hypothetical protein EDC05_006406 [Coemansia umbellata]KAJ2620553.1 hypothetical protein GGI26_004895 [Coemansia sp. RSA 1358]KAJ2673574.1 hypothetical protein GGI25_004675 [Coemansia spiralis]